MPTSTDPGRATVLPLKHWVNARRSVLDAGDELKQKIQTSTRRLAEKSDAATPASANAALISVAHGNRRARGACVRALLAKTTSLDVALGSKRHW